MIIFAFRNAYKNRRLLLHQLLIKLFIMKKNKISLLLLGLLSFSMLFSACSDDDDDDKNGDGFDSKIVGKWEFVSQKYWTTVNGELEGSEQTEPAREGTYDFIEFYKDGTGKEGESARPGDYNEWSIKWKIKDDMLTVTTDDEVDVLKITELTSETLIFQYEEDEGEGRVWHSISTFKREK